MDAPNQKDIGRSAPNASVAGTQSPPVDTNPRRSESNIASPFQGGRLEVIGLHSPKPLLTQEPFNKTNYQKQYMADLRTIKRLGLSVTVADYRKSKET